MAGKKRRNSQFWLTLGRLKRNHLAMVGLVIIVMMIVLALLAPYISPYSYEAADFKNRYATPSAEHWFGTDELGRDIFSRLLYGSRYSLRIGLISVAISAIGGIFFGAIAGYFGGAADLVLMRVCDAITAFPSILLALVLINVFGMGKYPALLSIYT